MGMVLLPVPRFSPVGIIPPLLHTYPILILVYLNDKPGDRQTQQCCLGYRGAGGGGPFEREGPSDGI